MKNVSETKTIHSMKLTNLMKKIYYTRQQSKNKCFAVLWKFAKLQFASLSTLFTDAFSNIAKDDDSVKKYQKER